MGPFHLHRFGVRLAVALVVLAIVMLAHAQHLQLVQLAGIAVLTLWVVIEARHANTWRGHWRRRARGARSKDAGEG